MGRPARWSGRQRQLGGRQQLMMLRGNRTQPLASGLRESGSGRWWDGLEDGAAGTAERATAKAGRTHGDGSLGDEELGWYNSSFCANGKIMVWVAVGCR